MNKRVLALFSESGTDAGPTDVRAFKDCRKVSLVVICREMDDIVVLKIGELVDLWEHRHAAIFDNQ